MLPGVEVTTGDAPPRNLAEIDTGTLFLAAFADRGPVDEALDARNIDQVVQQYGARQSYSQLYDVLDAYFKVGGTLAKIIRVVGPAAVTATNTLVDAGAANVLRVNAVSPGAWGNNIDVDVTASEISGSFIIVVSENDEDVEISPDLANNTEAIAWAATSEYIRLVSMGAADPAVQTKALATGADDRGSAVDSHFETAISTYFPKDLGPGQIMLPGRATAQANTDLAEHGAARNRWPLYEMPDTSNDGTIRTLAGTLRALGDDLIKYGEAWGSNAVIPGISPGTTRTIPYTAIQAGLIAKSESLGNSPNVAVAGENGRAPYVVDLTVDWTDDERELLNDAGVNVAILKYGEVRSYGDRTLVNSLLDDNWLQAPNGRMAMKIQAQAEAIAERFLFSQLDGKGHKIADFAGELKAMLNVHYESGALYGETAAQAFIVNTGPSVNTPETIANRELKAEIAVRLSPTAELVKIKIAKVPNTEAI